MSIFSSLKGPETYVIKEWVASETPNQDGVYVHISGRKGGLISWFLSFVGIDPIISLVVDRENVRFKEGNWKGFDMVVTPIGKLCSGRYGYAKPFWSNAFLVLIGFLLLMRTDGISILLILWGLYSYFANKTTKLGVTYLDGNGNEFAFKRSIIEGKNIDAVAAGRIISIIEMIMLGRDKPNCINGDVDGRSPGGIDVGEQARKKMDAIKEQAMRVGERAASKVSASLATASEDISRAVGTPEVKCPACGAKVTSEDAFCGSCGHTLH